MPRVWQREEDKALREALRDALYSLALIEDLLKMLQPGRFARCLAVLNEGCVVQINSFKEFSETIFLDSKFVLRAEVCARSHFDINLGESWKW